MVIDAAIDGQGIALARTTLAATDLISGRLVRPFAEELRLSKTYWIICPKATATLPKIVMFRDWLLAEAANDMRRLRNLGAGTSRSRSRQEVREVRLPACISPASSIPAYRLGISDLVTLGNPRLGLTTGRRPRRAPARPLRRPR